MIEILIIVKLREKKRIHNIINQDYSN